MVVSNRRHHERIHRNHQRDTRGVDLISDVLPFARLWYGGPNAISNAIGYTMHRRRSHPVVVRIYDGAGNVIETLEQRNASTSLTRFE